jgi:hypothetical protein
MYVMLSVTSYYINPPFPPDIFRIEKKGTTTDHGREDNFPFLFFFRLCSLHQTDDAEESLPAHRQTKHLTHLSLDLGQAGRWEGVLAAGNGSR